MTTQERHSFGVIPLYKDETGYYVALVKNRSGDHWGFPKGTPEEGENPFQTAVRETKEETGLSLPIVLDGVLFEEHYQFEENDEKIDKTNSYFVSIAKEKNELAPELPDVESVQWFSFSDAEKTITHDESKRVLRELRSYLKA